MDIFNNPYKNTESWSAQGAIIMWYIGSVGAESEANKVPLMINALNLQYGRGQQSFYPLNADASGNATRVNIKGAPTGALQFTSIYCPVQGQIDEFLKAAQRDCIKSGEEMLITIRPFGVIKCDDRPVTQAPRWICTGVEMNGLGLNIQSSEVTLVNMPLTFNFTGLKIDNP